MTKQQKIDKLIPEHAELINDKIDSEVNSRAKKYKNQQKYEKIIDAILHNIAYYINGAKRNLDYVAENYPAQKLIAEGNMESYEIMFKDILELLKEEEIDFSNYLDEVKKSYPVIEERKLCQNID